MRGVCTLKAVDENGLGEHFAFDGGSSWSKVFMAINRLSDDIGPTHDIYADPPCLAASRRNCHKTEADNLTINRLLRIWIVTRTKFGNLQM